MIARIINGFAAGVLISVGAMAYLMNSNKHIGALMFTVALCSICTLDFELFTGKVCYVDSIQDFGHSAVCLLSNIIGCLTASKMLDIANPYLRYKAQNLFLPKLNQEPLQTLFLAVMCGILMAIAVEVYRRNAGAGKYVGIFLCVTTFIICGFEHSVADIAYLFLSGMSIKGNIVSFLICVIFGNMAGGILMREFWEIGREID